VSAVTGPAANGQITTDIRLGLTAPLQALADADLKPGTIFGATVAYQVQPFLHVYVGWDWAHFAASKPEARAAHHYEETGYTFGARFEHPFRATTNWGYRLEAGGTVKHIETENADGDIIANSGHGPGYEIAAGFIVPVSHSWRIVPALRLRSLSRDITNGLVTKPGNLRYTAFEVGTSFRF